MTEYEKLKAERTSVNERHNRNMAAMRQAESAEEQRIKPEVHKLERKLRAMRKRRMAEDEKYYDLFRTELKARLESKYNTKDHPQADNLWNTCVTLALHDLSRIESYYSEVCLLLVSKAE